MAALVSLLPCLCIALAGGISIDLLSCFIFLAVQLYIRSVDLVVDFASLLRQERANGAGQLNLEAFLIQLLPQLIHLFLW